MSDLLSRAMRDRANYIDCRLNKRRYSPSIKCEWLRRQMFFAAESAIRGLLGLDDRTLRNLYVPMSDEEVVLLRCFYAAILESEGL